MWNSPSNPGTDNDINIEVQMAEAIATEGGDVDNEETDEADLVAIEVKGSLKTDEEDVQSSTTEEEGSDGDHDDMKNAKCLKLRNTEEYFKIYHPGCFIQDSADLWKSYFWPVDFILSVVR